MIAPVDFPVVVQKHRDGGYSAAQKERSVLHADRNITTKYVSTNTFDLIDQATRLESVVFVDRPFPERVSP
ncbi:MULTISPECIES: hypothetical protein [Burkholderia]|jgi:hypothetical protein|uniref:hypothetical protein n=1 Tax=Burkholderia TaxID=32008 RepID=UPI000F529566|nr:MULTISPECIES: hypothetical protein [Burkholderia]RQM59628.1 hypothetical protein EHZ18_08810 [Burkholderia vietnamiensis]